MLIFGIFSELPDFEGVIMETFRGLLSWLKRNRMDRTFRFPFWIGRREGSFKRNLNI